MRIVPVDQPHVVPYLMPPRFRTDVAYFMTPAGEPGVPPLGPHEYFIRHHDARRWLEEMCISLVSPLSADATTEIEISDEQEAWLEWMVRHEIQHIRVED
jgi:hypothetical protein